MATSWLQRASTAADAAQATIGLTGELAANAYDLANAARSTAYSQAAAIQNGMVQTRSVGGLQADPGLGKSLVVARDSRQVETHARNLAQLADSVRADTDSAIYAAEPQLAYALGSGWGPIKDRKGGDPSEWPKSLQVQQIPTPQ